MARTKTQFVGVRTTAEQRKTLLKLATLAGKPGNMSAGLRWWLDRAPEQDNGAILTMQQARQRGADRG